MIKPTIGRVVLVRRGGNDQAEPALICYVWNDKMINVAGFDADGEQFAITSLHLKQDDEENPPMPYAEWMPYQKAVASGAQAPTLHAQP